MASHPELRRGEIWLTNIEDPVPRSFLSIGWKTKRLGSIAYDICGKPVTGMRPVFVQQSELKEAGINPDSFDKSN